MKVSHQTSTGQFPTPHLGTEHPGSPLPTAGSTHCAGVGQDRNLALPSIGFHFITLSSSRVLQTLRRPFKTFADASLINQISFLDTLQCSIFFLSCGNKILWRTELISTSTLSPPKSFEGKISPVWAQILLVNLFYCYSLTRFITPLSKWQLQRVKPIFHCSFWVCKRFFHLFTFLTGKAVSDGAWECGHVWDRGRWLGKKIFSTNIFLELKLKAEKIYYSGIFMLLYLRWCQFSQHNPSYALRIKTQP